MVVDGSAVGVDDEDGRACRGNEEKLSQMSYFVGFCCLLKEKYNIGFADLFLVKC